MDKRFYPTRLPAAILACLLAAGCGELAEQGVSEELAAARRGNIRNVDYSIRMSIPARVEQRIASRVEVRFELKRRQRVVLDYRMGDPSLVSVTVNGHACSAKPRNGHIVVPARHLQEGANRVDIHFYAGEASLNRKPEFLYTLLVPDRASTVFPCFDQPDMKATFNLTLEIPKGWSAVANAARESLAATDTSCVVAFGKTEPISTYLFAFAAGRFDSISRNENGRSITLYHRENDTQKVERNLSAIFGSHFHSLRWLERYTGIAYPFGKLDIVLIPDFQYGGMEHPGAIFYRDAHLLLDEHPPVNQKLRQANLIAHEVAHQWFGNLVTMRWFNDVWLKEVFAGLMADKIVNPQYPEVNHQLRFLLSHYPRAYSVDRTSGSNPIRQRLGNLLLAGTLYGDIIYHKAPIAMMQLERAMGETLFRQGVRQYLELYRMGNASWDELIAVLDSLTPTNLKEWSRAWIEQAGMPTITPEVGRNGGINLRLTQQANGALLPMEYSVARVAQNSDPETVDVRHTQAQAVASFSGREGDVLLNFNGLGYGQFALGAESIKRAIGPTTIANAVGRASNLITVNEAFLAGKLGKSDYFDFLIRSLAREKEPQIRSYLLACIETVWWRFLSQDERVAQTHSLELTLHALFSSKHTPVDERKPVFQSYSRTALSHEATESLMCFWSGQAAIEGVALNEQDLTALALEIAIRNPDKADSLLDAQQERITNGDRLAKFKFVKRAVSPDEATRSDFFHSLLSAHNRRPEPWAAEALRYLNHPLRSAYSIRHLGASLDLLPEIQQTGDIFFPKQWLDAILWGHSSPEAAKIVTDWLNSHPQVSENLRSKLLQSADMLFRATGTP